MMDYFRRRLSLEDRPVRLKQVLSGLKSRPALVCAFLALLEMVRLQAILLRQDKVFSDIIVKKNTMFDTVFGEGGAAAMRDDWK
jgi:segregation and condensation protein A